MRRTRLEELHGLTEALRHIHATNLERLARSAPHEFQDAVTSAARSRQRLQAANELIALLSAHTSLEPDGADE